ncbi:MAG: GNAT family N-acetyltransferase [Microscillaceae bacterium]|jgi:RimJ/RimL family protein N-acetyltransferase|nr:GNAT family N-acetyltransferase [Microscillaceae bacterium]
MLITGENIVIRPFSKPDLQDYYELMSSEEVFEYELSYALNFEQTTQELAIIMENYRREKPTTLTLGVEHRIFHKIIGYFTITYSDPAQTVAMIGFAFHPAFWRKGLAYQTIEAFVNYFFAQQGIRVFCSTMGNNERTIKLMEKLGFRREGTLRQSLWAKNRLCDEAFFGIMREEWNNTKP